MMFVLLALLGYLIGSVPSGYLTMRLFTGKDIRTFGTGSATVTAVMIHGGKRPGILAFLLELSKGIICVVIAHYLVGKDWATLVILVAAVFGCNWSIWLRGGGGQGLTIGISGLVLVILFLWYGSWEWFLAGFLIVIPSFIKGWLYGDDVVEARKAGGVSQIGAGAS
jgi:glycerol-3-phosphate acyltransferase PlsY